jgi:hypothetical protein
MGNPNPSPSTRFKSGKDWNGNAGGRPKGGLKDYDRQRFIAMSDKEKDAFLKKIAPELRYRMAEGNPSSDDSMKVTGDIIVKTVKYS